jgi:subtilisin family serine protease
MLLPAAIVGAAGLLAQGPAFSQMNSISVGPRIGAPTMAPMRAPNINMNAGPRYSPGMSGHGGGHSSGGGGFATGLGIGLGVGIGTGIIMSTPPAGAQPVYQQPVQRQPKVRQDANRKSLSGKPPTNTNPVVRTPQPPAIPSLAGRPHVPNEVLVEFTGIASQETIDDAARRHGIGRLDAQSFTLTNSTIVRFGIPDGRPIETVLQQLQGDGAIQSFQANFRFVLSQSAMANAPAYSATEGDPAQYVLSKLRLPLAHGLARGDSVLVAVIDSGVDTDHPEFNGVVAGKFDALDADEPPHAHGTAIAGAIAAHSKLRGAAPGARLLAIRAFGSSAKTAEGTTFGILKSLDWAVAQNARIINMSFAAARAKGAILIAAAGNAGAKSPPLYPAADPNVIAVTATDANDKLFGASNRGDHIAVAAPGVDILLPAPEANYQMSTGTSFAAAHISGVVALLLERKPALTQDNVRAILVSTAKDLGPKGRDRDFGAGLADAYNAVEAVAGAVASSAAAKR